MAGTGTFIQGHGIFHRTAHTEYVRRIEFTATNSFYLELRLDLLIILSYLTGQPRHVMAIKGTDNRVHDVHKYRKVRERQTNAFIIPEATNDIIKLPLSKKIETHRRPQT